MLRKLGGRSVPATPRSAQQQSTPTGAKEKSCVDHGYKYDVANKANQGTPTDSKEAAVNHQWLPANRVLSLLDGFAYTLLIDSERRALLRAKGLRKQLVNGEDYELINSDSKGPSILDDSGSSVLAYMSWGMEHFEKAAACRSKEARVELLDKAEPMLSSLTRSMDAQGWTGGCSSSRHVSNAVLLGLAHLYLALIWKLRLNAVRRVATHILQVFIVCPKYARLSFAPELWQQLFKPPLAGVEAWYRKEYNNVVGYSKSLSAFVRSSPCSPINALDFDDDEDYNHRHQDGRRASADINSRLLLASVEKKRADKIKMQINLLYELYEETLDEGTQQYALHYQELISKGSLGNESRGKGLYNHAANQQSNRRGLTSNVDESKSTSNIAMESKCQTKEKVEVTTGNSPDTGGQRPSFDAGESIPDAAASSTSIWTFGSGKPLQLRRSLYEAIFGAVFHTSVGKSGSGKSAGRASTNSSTSAASTPGSFLRLCNKELPQVHLHVKHTNSINVSSNPVSLSKLQSTSIGFEGRRPAAIIPEDTELDADHIRLSDAVDYANYKDEDDPRKYVAAGLTMRCSSTRSGSNISLREPSSYHAAPSCPPASSTVVPDQHRATSAINDGSIKLSARLAAARKSSRLIDLIGDSESETSRTNHHPNIRPVLTALRQSSAAKAHTQRHASNSKSKISSGLDAADQKTPAADVVGRRRSRRSSFSSAEGPMREKELPTAGQPRSSFYNAGDQYRRGSRDARKNLVETAQLIREGKHIVLLQPASHHRSSQVKKSEEAGSLNKSSCSSAERSDGAVRQWNHASGRMRRLQPRQLQYSTAARRGSGTKEEEDEEKVVEKAVVEVRQDRKMKKEGQDIHIMAPSKVLNEEQELVDQGKYISIDATGENDQCMKALVQELREEVRAAKQEGGSVQKCEEVLLRLSLAWLECKKKKKSKPLKHREEEHDGTGAHVLHQLGQVVDELLYILAISKLPEAQRLSLCLLSSCTTRSRTTDLSDSHIHDDIDGSSTVTKTAAGSPECYNNSTHEILSVALSHLLQQPGRLPEAALLLNLFHPSAASRHLPLLLPLLMDIIVAERSKPGSSCTTSTSHPAHDPAAIASSINNSACCNRSALVSLDAQLPPRALALKLVSHLLSAADPASRLRCCRHHLLSSPRALPCLLQSLQRSCRSSTALSLDECVAAASILTTCIQCSSDAPSRHRILAQVDASSLVALLQRTAGTVAAFQTAVGFVTEVLYCSRRGYWVDILGRMRHDGLLNCMHALMAYLQSASLEQQPPAAGLLLQMDLLAVNDGQRPYSVFREEALDSLVTALNSDRVIDMEASLSAARTLARMAGSALVHSERSVSALVASHDIIHCHQQGVLEAWLLKKAGLAGQCNSVNHINSNSKMHRNNSKSSSGRGSSLPATSTNPECYNQDLPTINELSGEQERPLIQEDAADEASMQWDGKLGRALLHHGRPLFLALAKHLRAAAGSSPLSSSSSSSSSSGAASDLRKTCLVLVAWMSCYLGTEPPTRISFGGARPAGGRRAKPPNNSMSKSAAAAASTMREAVASQLHAAVMANNYNHKHRRGAAADWAIDERIFAALALQNLGEEYAATI